MLAPPYGVSVAVNGARESVNGDQMLENFTSELSTPCQIIRRDG